MRGAQGPLGPSEKEEKAGQEGRGAGCQDSEGLKPISLQDVKAATTEFQAGSSTSPCSLPLPPTPRGRESHCGQHHP